MTVSIQRYAFINKISALPFVDAILLFGSRARGEHQERSDIDLAVVCPGATDREWLQIMDIAEDADTLLKIDVIRLDRLSDQALKSNIIRDGVVLYRKESGNG